MSEHPKIPSLGSVSRLPDKDTKKAPDFTSPQADERVLHINLWFFKYGTNDKIHAAALVLSLILLSTIIAVIIYGMNATNVDWTEKAFNWLGSAFLFISGIALGGKTSNGSNSGNNDNA